MKDKASFAITFLFFVLSSAPAWATNYYVDYVDGLDTNTGTLQITAWKHCPGDEQATSNASITVLQAGDNIYFKRGVTYIGEITCNISGQLCDSGANGTIKAGGVFTSADQNFLTTVATGDYICIYNHEEDGDGNLTPGGKYLGSIGVWRIDSVNSDTQLTLDGFDGEAYSTPAMYYHIQRMISYTSRDDWGTGDAVISGDYTTTRLFRVNNGKNYLRWAYLNFQNTYWPPNGSCVNSAFVGAIIQNGGGYKVTGHVVEHCSFNSCWQGHYMAGSDYSVFQHNTSFDNGQKIFSGGIDGLIQYNIVDNGGNGFAVGNYETVVRFNRITNMSKGKAEICGEHSNAIFPIVSPAADPGGNKYGWIYGNYFANVVEGIQSGNTSGGIYGWTYHSNVFVGYLGIVSGPYGRVGQGSEAIEVEDAPHTKIYNNTFIGMNGQKGWISAVKIFKTNTASTNCELKNNIFYFTGLNDGSIGVGYSGAGDNSADGFISSNNYFYYPNSTVSPFGIYKVEKSWSQWQAAGYDVSGSAYNTDPKLVDAVVENPNGEVTGQLNLSLQSSSPCRDAGAVLSPYFTTDINGTSRPSGIGWDIGAFEYISTSQQQVVNLTSGWNWISFNVLSTDLSLNSIFSGILGQVEQLKTQTQSDICSNGAWKGDLADMSGIGQYKMYKVKVSANCTLTVTGTAVLSANPIQLGGGWNWVAFLPTTAMPIATALATINGQVQEVKSLTQSATYNGSAWNGTLTQLEPGQGYAVKMNASGTLTYPAAASTQLNQQRRD
jgi:hypothetical protein